MAKRVIRADDAWRKRLASVRHAYGDKQLVARMGLTSNRNIRLWASGQRNPSEPHRKIINKLWRDMWRVSSWYQNILDFGQAEEDLLFARREVEHLQRLAKFRPRAERAKWLRQELLIRIFSLIQEMEISESEIVRWTIRQHHDRAIPTSTFRTFERLEFGLVSDVAGNDAIGVLETIYMLFLLIPYPQVTFQRVIQYMALSHEKIERPRKPTKTRHERSVRMEPTIRGTLLRMDLSDIRDALKVRLNDLGEE